MQLIRLTLDLHSFGKPPEEFWYAQGCPSSSQVKLLQLKDVGQTSGSARRQASLQCLLRAAGRIAVPHFDLGLFNGSGEGREDDPLTLRCHGRVQAPGHQNDSQAGQERCENERRPDYFVNVDAGSTRSVVITAGRFWPTSVPLFQGHREIQYSGFRDCASTAPPTSSLHGQ